MTDLAAYEGTTDVTPRPDLLDPVTDSWVASIADVVRLSSYICNTAFVPNGLRGSAPATAATILYGREIGIPPITALQTMHVINGRVGMAAELMRARVLAAGHELETLESTAALCRMRGRRRGSDTWTECQWSKGDAQQAGLGGDGWRKYPRAMLVARCSAELCRLVFPDVTHGMAALEELDSIAPEREQAATTPRLVGRQPRKTPPPQALDAATSGVVATDSPQAEGADSAPHSPHPQPVVEPPQPVAPAPPQALPPLPGEDEPGSPPQGEDTDADPRVQGALTGDGPATQPQVRHIMLLLRKIGMGQQRDDRLAIAEAITQRRLETFSQLTVTDAGRIITTLILASESAQPRDYLRWLLDEGQRLLAEREAADRDAMAQADAELGVGDE
jgi:hypothetical protein